MQGIATSGPKVTNGPPWQESSETRLTELQLLLQSNTAEDLYDALYRDGPAWYFQSEFHAEHEQKFREFRDLVATCMEVQDGAMSLVGSARVGFSFNPKRRFRPFSKEDSDFDIAVISDSAFEEIWDEYFAAHYSRASGSLKGHRSEIFRRFVTTSGLTDGDPQHAVWERRFGPLRREIGVQFGFDGDVRFRVYRNHEALRQYHLDGLREIQRFMRPTEDA